MVDKTDFDFADILQQLTAKDSKQPENEDKNLEIDFEKLDKSMEELVLTIKDFTINNIRSKNNIKEADKIKKPKKPVKKLDVEKIRKAIIEATEIAKSKQTTAQSKYVKNNKSSLHKM